MYGSIFHRLKNRNIQFSGTGGNILTVGSLQVIITSEEQKRRVLDLVNSNIKTWRVKVMKVKAIYHIMNQFHTEGKNYVAECWIPTEEVGTVQTILNSHTVSNHGNMVQTMLNSHTVSDHVNTIQTILNS